MRAFSQLPRPVLLLELAGMMLLVASPLALREMLPLALSGKRAAMALLLAGSALMLPAVTVIIWRTAKLMAPELFNMRSARDKDKPGDSDDADY